MSERRGLVGAQDYVSVDRGEIDRRIFSDEDIFEAEMDLIFSRAWLFLAHETQIPNPGDFFEAAIGRDNVLVVRQKDGSIKGLLNTCTHRGNAVCRAEEGNVRVFMCTYHGWSFDISGELIGVPGINQFYKGDLDMTQLGLVPIAQLESYHGFIFGTLDPTAPPLEDYLGRMGRVGLDSIAAQGDMEAVPGIQKFTIDCNWKFAADNVYDWYHPQVTHMSSQHSGILRRGTPPPSSDDGRKADVGGAKTSQGDDLALAQGGRDELVFLSEFGHATSGPTTADVFDPEFHEWRKTERAQEMLGPVAIRSAGHPYIFPSTWVTTGSQISIRVPLSVNKTEIWWFTFVDKDASPEYRAKRLFRANHVFGPAGILEQEDGENWAQSSMQTRGVASRRIPQVLRMNHGRGKIIKEDGLARIEGLTNEHAQLWTYHAWAQWMKGLDWDELKAATEPGEYL